MDEKPADIGKRGFTLTELLVVIAIVAVLFIVVVVVINPFNLLQQARDARRISDLASLNGAITLYQSQERGLSGYSLGSASTSYMSIADPSATSTTAGDQCQGLGMPSAITGYSYHCAATSTNLKVGGTGWLPIAFSSMPTGASFGALPVDPKNQTSSDLYFTYETTGSQWLLTAFFESQKYAKTQSLGSNDPSLYEIGSAAPSSFSDIGRGLLGYWQLSEGAGSVAYDTSGNGNNGTWMQNNSDGVGAYATGKVGAWAASFNGTTTYILANFPTMATSDPVFSCAAWVYPSSTVPSGDGTIVEVMTASLSQTCRFLYHPNSTVQFLIKNIAQSQVLTSAISIPTSSWTFLAGTSDGSNLDLYVNGVLQSSVALGSTTPSGGPSTTITIGAGGIIGTSTQAYEPFAGEVDDVRVYGRLLSAAEIQEIYNTEK